MLDSTKLKTQVCNWPSMVLICYTVENSVETYRWGNQLALVIGLLYIHSTGVDTRIEYSIGI